MDSILPGVLLENPSVSGLVDLESHIAWNNLNTSRVPSEALQKKMELNTVALPEVRSVGLELEALPISFRVRRFGLFVNG